MASCTAQDTSNADAPGSDTRGRAFNWPAWQEAFAHAEGLTPRNTPRHRIGPAGPPRALGLAITTTTRGGTTTR